MPKSNGMTPKDSLQVLGVSLSWVQLWATSKQHLITLSPRWVFNCIAQQQPHALLSWTRTCQLLVILCALSRAHNMWSRVACYITSPLSVWQHQHTAKAGISLLSSSGISLEAQLEECSLVGCQHQRMSLTTNNSIARHETMWPMKGQRQL